MIPPRQRSMLGPSAGLLAVVLLVLAGCGRSPITPHSASLTTPGTTTDAIAAATLPVEDASGGLLVRLVEGDHATLDHEFRVRIKLTGETEPGPWETFNDRRERTTLGTDVKAGVTYVVQEEVSPDAGTLVSYLRQDRSGLFLYQEDTGPLGVQPALERVLAARPVSVSTRAALENALARIVARMNSVQRGPGGIAEMAVLAGPGGRVTTARPGGVGANEITFLRYPLHPGASWDGRIGFNVWTVEGLEQLSLPGGHFRSYRLNIDLPEFFSPEDSYTIWYAEPGEVKHSGRFVDDAVDETGAVVGIVETEDDLVLTSWSPAD